MLTGDTHHVTESGVTTAWVVSWQLIVGVTADAPTWKVLTVTIPENEKFSPSPGPSTNEPPIVDIGAICFPR